MTELIRTEAAKRKVLNEAEQTTVDALLAQLSSGWYVIPHVPFEVVSGANAGKYETDCVIAHPQHGWAIVETKGHRVSLAAGTFYGNGKVLDPQPNDQLRRNAYGLVDFLSEKLGRKLSITVAQLLSAPNTSSIEGGEHPALSKRQILVAPDVDLKSEGTADKVEEIVENRTKILQDEAEFQECLRAICPNADFIWDAEARARRARDRLKELCDQRVEALESLDRNRRIVVTGGAGSGKTRLAVRWAQRAAARGETVLMVSYNDPLGYELQERITPREGVVVGPFLRVIQQLPGMPPIEEPANAGDEWWKETLPTHIEDNFDQIRIRFDTIVVDEAQDFQQRWVDIMHRLLSNDGARLIFLADPEQDIYNRSAPLPLADESWVQCDLTLNTRNTHDIAQLLRRRFSGAQSHRRNPASDTIHYAEAANFDDVVSYVGGEIDRLRSAGVPDSSILVTTVTTAMRDPLRREFGFVGWEKRENGIVCENVHRVKGTEFDHVILVGLIPAREDSESQEPQEVRDRLLYIGISRAVLGLSVIAPRPVLDRLGFD